MSDLTDDEVRALARREVAMAQRERDAYATRAAEWLAEKHLADEDHASDVEIAVAREREACAAMVDAYDGDWHDEPEVRQTLVNLAAHIRARGDAGRGDGD